MMNLATIATMAGAEDLRATFALEAAIRDGKNVKAAYEAAIAARLAYIKAAHAETEENLKQKYPSYTPSELDTSQDYHLRNLRDEYSKQGW